MVNDLFLHRKEIGQRLFDYIRTHGYSKSSFSKAVKISRPTLDDLLEGSIPSETTYMKHMEKIVQAIGESIDYFLQDHIAPSDSKAFVQWEAPVTTFSDRAPNGFQRDCKVQEVFKWLEDVYYLCDLYIGQEDEVRGKKSNHEENFEKKFSRDPFRTVTNEITKKNLDEIVQINCSIRDELNRYVEVFQEQYKCDMRMSPEKVAFEVLKKNNLLQLPIPDQYFGGAIRKLRNGYRVPLINTAQPRLYQYFIYWHEVYHLLFDPYLNEETHLVSIELEMEERKADYFAALMLMKNEVYHYYHSISETDFYRRVALCMDSYKAPYKAVLIQLYENAYEYHDFETMRYVKEYFDRKLPTNEWIDLFEEMGLDIALLETSNVLSWGRLQCQIEKELQNNPDLSYHQHNLEFLKQITNDVRLTCDARKTDLMFEVEGQFFAVEVRYRSGNDGQNIPVVPKKVVQKDEETLEVELKICKADK